MTSRKTTDSHRHCTKAQQTAQEATARYRIGTSSARRNRTTAAASSNAANGARMRAACGSGRAVTSTTSGEVNAQHRFGEPSAALQHDPQDQQSGQRPQVGQADDRRASRMDADGGGELPEELPHGVGDQRRREMVGHEPRGQGEAA